MQLHEFTIRTSVTVICLCLVLSTASALTLEELNRYDRNRNQQIDPGFEEEVYFKHLQNNILRRYDTDPMNGRLDPTEVTAIENATEPKLGKSYSETEVDEARADLVSGHSRSLKAIADPPAPLADKTKETQRFFLRNNRLDIAVYNQSIDKKAAEGASLDYSYNADGEVSEFHIDGVAAWVLARNTRVPRPKSVPKGDPFVSGYAWAAWTDFDYRFNDKKTSREINKLIFGLDGQIEIFDENRLTVHYLTIGPSFQTDFDFSGKIYGAEISWQPYNTSIALGGYQGLPKLGIGYTWLAKADALFQYVEDPGKTSFTKDDNNLWLGGVLSSTVWIAPEKLKRRLFVKASLPYHYDAIQNLHAIKFNSSLNYNLDDQGITAISLSYENGRDYKTGNTVQQYEFGLKAKF